MFFISSYSFLFNSVRACSRIRRLDFCSVIRDGSKNNDKPGVSTSNLFFVFLSLSIVPITS